MTKQGDSPADREPGSGTGSGTVKDWDNAVKSKPDPDGDETVGDAHTQSGVQKIEAVTVAWTTTALVIACAMIWVTYFVEGMLSATMTSLNPYVTSTFAQHSLTPTVGILSSIIEGGTNLTIAKILDVFGRPQEYLFCTVLATVGLNINPTPSYRLTCTLFKRNNGTLL